MRFQIVSCITLSLAYFISAAPDDLTCGGVLRRPKYELKNCKMNNGKINCQSYIEISTMVVLHLNSTYNILEESQIPGYHSCLGVEDMKIERLNHLPVDAVNKHTLSKINPISTTVAKFRDLFVHLSLKSSAVVGLLQLKPSCNTSDILNQDESCINKIEVNSFILAPTDTDFSVSDLYLGKVQQLYFDRMNATVEKIAVRLNGENVDVSSYLSKLEGGKIQSLEVKDTKLSSEFMLRNLPSLVQLTLKNCSLKEIDARNFDNEAGNIEILDLSENELTSPPEDLNYLKNLRSLNLSGQKVTNFILGEQLTSLNNLTEVNLSNMHVTGIKRTSFPNSTSLQSIDLSACQLQNLDEDSFYNIKDLKQLKLSGNQLSQIKPKTFERMSVDSKIYLDNNKITREPRLYLPSDVEVTGITFERLQGTYEDSNTGSLKNISFVGNLMLIYFLLYFLLY